MREIKFRVWIKIAQQMGSWDEIVERKNLHRLIDNSEYPLMQFTGLTDKNGVDIYEGDIVEWIMNDTSDLDVGVIEWDKTYAGFGITGDHCLDFNHIIKVIGNIYQNPELIKEQS